MPRVPLSQQELRPLATAPVPDAQAVGPANAARRASDALQAAAIEQQQIADADALFRAESGIRGDYLKFEQSLREKRGVNAWGATKDATNWWADAGKRYMEGLGTDVQRRAFEQTLAGLSRQSIDTVSTYEADQQRVSLTQNAKATQVNAANFAAANHSNPEAIANAKRDILASNEIVAALDGWAPEMKAAADADAVSDLHTQVLGAMADSDPDGAAAYFAENESEIVGTNREAVKKLVETAGVRKRAQDIVDGYDGTPLSEALADVRKKHSGELEDEVVRRLKEREAEVDAIREQGQRRAADAAWQILGRTGRVSDIPTGLLNALDGQTRIAIESEARVRAEGGRTTTDWTTYEDLRRSIIAGETVDLRQHFPKLAEAQRKQLIDLQTKAREDGGQFDAATLAQQLGNVHELLGWVGATNAETRGKFDAAVTAAIDAEQKRLGRKLAFDERQKVVDLMLIEGSVSKNWWPDKSVRLFEVAGTADQANFSIEVPDDERKKIEAALTRAGQPVTDEAVLNLYRRKMGLQ